MKSTATFAKSLPCFSWRIVCIYWFTLALTTLKSNFPVNSARFGYAYTVHLTFNHKIMTQPWVLNNYWLDDHPDTTFKGSYGPHANFDYIHCNFGDLWLRTGHTFGSWTIPYLCEYLNIEQDVCETLCPRNKIRKKLFLKQRSHSRLSTLAWRHSEGHH